jgi:hypothetical protein
MFLLPLLTGCRAQMRCGPGTHADRGWCLPDEAAAEPGLVDSAVPEDSGGDTAVDTSVDTLPPTDSAVDTGSAPDTGVDDGLREWTSAGCGGTDDFATIADALTHTREGGTVEICGHHVENIVVTRSVSLVGVGDASLEGAPTARTVDAVIESAYTGPAALSIQGLTVSAPLPDVSTISLRDDDISLSITDSTIYGASGEYALEFGGARGVVDLTRSVFSSTAVALWFLNTPGLSMVLDEVTIEDTGGETWSGWSYAAVRLPCYICDEPADVTIRNSTFTNNFGDAVIEVSGPMFVSIFDSSITDNDTELGALYLSTGTEGTVGLINSEVLRNTASRSGNGGAALVYDGLLISDYTDWGEGPTDNSTPEIRYPGNRVSYEGRASFTCADTGCY